MRENDLGPRRSKMIWYSVLTLEDLQLPPPPKYITVSSDVYNAFCHYGHQLTFLETQSQYSQAFVMPFLPTRLISPGSPRMPTIQETGDRIHKIMYYTRQILFPVLENLKALDDDYLIGDYTSIYVEIFSSHITWGCLLRSNSSPLLKSQTRIKLCL